MAQSKEPTIEQMDITIARFMGMEGSDNFLRQNYQTHVKWELLMPVVERIERMGYMTVIGGGSAWGYYMNIIYNGEDKNGDTKAVGRGKTKIESVYNAVIEFIEYYNQQPQPNGQNNAG